MSHETYQAATDLPVAAETPLAYLEEPDEEGYHRKLYYFDTDQLRDRYVVRPMQVEDSSEDPRAYTREQQAAILHDELGRLRAAGVRVPRVVTGLPEDWQSDASQLAGQQPVMVATERVAPADPHASDPALLAHQARRTVAGLAGYLRDSWSPERHAARAPYLYDVCKARQFVYGTVPGETGPDFYMVDTGLNIDQPDYDSDGYDSVYSRRASDLMDTAREFAALTGDDTLISQTAQAVQMPVATAADR